MKYAYNKNDLGLYPVDDEFTHDCENCVFLRSIAPYSYKCILIDFGEKNVNELPSCFNSIFIPESLSSIFEL